MPNYRKKPSLVEARQVTVGMIHRVAEWSEGSVKGALLPVSERVIEINNQGIEQRAEIGDWIVKEANGAFNVYTDEAFRLMHEVE